MDFETKYYRPNLANGTAGASKTTPTPIRRSATKWAMPVDGGGSVGGPEAFMKIEITPAIAGVAEQLAAKLPYTPEADADPEIIRATTTETIAPQTEYNVTIYPGSEYYGWTESGGSTEKAAPFTFTTYANDNGLQFDATTTDSEDLDNAHWFNLDVRIVTE